MANTISRVITDSTYTATIINSENMDIKKVSFNLAGDPVKSVLMQLAFDTAKEQGFSGYEVFKVERTEIHKAKQYTMEISDFIQNAERVTKRSLGRYVSKNIEFTKIDMAFYSRSSGNIHTEHMEFTGKVFDYVKTTAKEFDFFNESGLVFVDYEILSVTTGLYEMPEKKFMELAVVSDIEIVNPELKED